MLQNLISIARRLSLLVLLYSATGCHSDDDASTAYEAYTFDQQVIEKLPVYDSLVAAILENFPLFQKLINEDDSYKAFRYMPASTDTEVFKKLPPEAGNKIDHYFTKLGKDFVFGFDMFKDSSIKIYIRSRPSAIAPVDIEENLSYYPTGGNMKQREFPVKDTVLNKYWQYWTRVNKQRIF